MYWTDLGRKKVLGELDHPADGKTSLKRVSHIITNLQVMDDGQIVGEAEVLNTEAGKTLKALIKALLELDIHTVYAVRAGKHILPRAVQLENGTWKLDLLQFKNLVSNT